MGIFTRTTPITVKIPKLGFKRYDNKVDWDEIAKVLFVGTWIIVFITLAFALTFKAVIHLTEKPPRVITKTVYLSAQSAREKAFIDQCKQNHEVPAGSSYDNYGVPNTSVQPWTCTFAKQ